MTHFFRSKPDVLSQIASVYESTAELMRLANRHVDAAEILAARRDLLDLRDAIKRAYTLPKAKGYAPINADLIAGATAIQSPAVRATLRTIVTEISEAIEFDNASLREVSRMLHCLTDQLRLVQAYRMSA